MITNKDDCQAAAKALGRTDITVFGNGPFPKKGRPHGCINAIPPRMYNDWLSWSPSIGHPYDNVPCGTLDKGFKYECLCVVTGKLKIWQSYILFEFN